MDAIDCAICSIITMGLFAAALVAWTIFALAAMCSTKEERDDYIFDGQEVDPSIFDESLSDCETVISRTVKRLEVVS